MGVQLQDAVRTGTYHWAFQQNTADFSGAVVLDVGTGTGLLAFFSAQAGARKVYAVEHAAPMAALARTLVHGNHMDAVIEVQKRILGIKWAVEGVADCGEMCGGEGGGGIRSVP